MQDNRVIPITTGCGDVSNLTLNLYLRRTFASLVPALIFFLTLITAGHAGQFPGGIRDTLGPRFRSDPRCPTPVYRQSAPSGTDLLGRIRHWNEIAINASGLDHTPVAPGENRVFGE